MQFLFKDQNLYCNGPRAGANFLCLLDFFCSLISTQSVKKNQLFIVLGIFHALQGDFKGTGGWGGISFSTEATYLYGNYSPAAVRNFGETVP